MKSSISILNHADLAPDTPRIKLAINGKFLRPTAGKSGVYRVARELLVAIDLLLSKNPHLAAIFSCRLIVGPDCLPLDFRLTHVITQSTGRFSGSINDTLWEQLVLPWAARGRVLINLSNVGPGFFSNAFTMIHDAQVHEYPLSYSMAFRLWYRLLQPRLGRSNKSIFTVSNYSRNQLVEYGVAPASSIRVIYNGCDHVLRLKPDSSIVKRSGLDKKRYVVGLSNTQVHKNIAVLFEAFSSEMLSGMTLVLFGAASREDFKRLGYVVPLNVNFIGRISDQELYGLLESAVSLVFPSLTEGFGLPPLESMALGCPVIVAPCGAVPEVCGDAALQANPHEAHQWVQQIVRLCEEPVHASRVVADGLLRSAEFTWERAATQLLDVVSQQAMPVWATA